ncbi:MAG: peptide deformylase, partial [Phycisphaerales bacterium]
MADPSPRSINPADLAIVLYPAPVLRARAKEIAEITPALRAAAAAMFEIMVAEEGIGLAAPQVGLPWRMFIADVPKDPKAKPLKGEFAGLPVSTDGP